ncbi:hypothetical protein RRF57_004021 [Xylaria bambusicola]|uniref:Uncharacterized protein n=1 Tax=Xylaria bambusicola TaxID=326684 RepID=A0AAN7UL96_9PEZI
MSHNVANGDMIPGPRSGGISLEKSNFGGGVPNMVGQLVWEQRTNHAAECFYQCFKRAGAALD